MPKKKWLIIFILGMTLCTLAIVCIAIALMSTNMIPSLFLPVYTLQQTASTHNGYRHTTLSDGNTVYVNDYEEAALLSANTQPPDMIGRLPVYESGVSGIYAIPGQDPSAYALEYDPMYQEVFRNVQHPPFDWRTAEFQKMRIGIPTGPAANKETTDSQVIQDVLTTLKDGTVFTVPLQTTGNYSNYGNYGIHLFSDQLPGLVYVAGIHIDPAGQVYLAENGISNQWHPASQLFLEWMNSK